MTRLARLAFLAALGLAAAAAPVRATQTAAPDAAPAPEAEALDETALLALARVQPRSRAEATAGAVRCTPDGALCIRLADYVADVCRAIEASAAANAIDPAFFARLIWKESLFDAGAVSPKGAQGIAQFIPETARLRGLGDPFNPAEALAVSAAYLAELADELGNIGLAAVAYNGGEARAARFKAAEGGLPLETRAYVRAITGHSAETWRDAPPATLDLALAPPEGGAADFQSACVALGAKRNLREFPGGPPLLPWGVIVASNAEREGAERQASRLRNRYAAVLGAEEISYSRGRRPGMPRSMHFAQIGRNSRAEADALCTRLRGAGADCMVLRN